MAKQIPKQFIHDLLSRIDIVSVIRQRLALQKKGNNYSACCPFHTEKTPSFTVSEPKQFYHCFGCGVSGDVIRFIMEYDRLSFVEAIEMLAAQAGLTVPSTDAENNEALQPLFSANEWATTFYRQQLKQSQTAINYLKERGLTGDIAKHFLLGFAVDSWDRLAQQAKTEKKSPQALQDVGLVGKSRQGSWIDRLRNRIIFPIRDVRGRVIGFGGRTLGDDSAKYLNSPETPIFHKSYELYGLYEAKKSGPIKQLMIVEGYMDVIALAQFDITYAVATLGTATSSSHIQKLLRYTQDIIFCFDGDKAGQRAAWRALTTALPIANDGVSLRFLFLPEGDDPDSLVRRIGKEAFEAKLQQAMTLSQFLFHHLDQEFPEQHLDSKVRYAKTALKLINTIPTGLFKELLSDELAKHLAIDLAQLAHLNDNSATTQEQPPSPATTQDTTPWQAPAAPIKLLMTLLLQQPSVALPALAHTPLNDWQIPGAKLLQALYRRFKEQPDTHIGELLRACPDGPKHQLLAELAAWHHGIDEDKISEEIGHTALRCQQIHQQALAEQLIGLSKQRPLTTEERERLKTLLSDRNNLPLD